MRSSDRSRPLCELVLGVWVAMSATAPAQAERLPDLALLEMLGEMSDAEDIGVDVDAWINDKMPKQDDTQGVPRQQDTAGDSR